MLSASLGYSTQMILSICRNLEGHTTPCKDFTNTGFSYYQSGASETLSSGMEESGRKGDGTRGGGGSPISQEDQWGERGRELLATL